nr:hypothetical protein BaRGS_023080 [Batillaria attramentaria]
MVIASVSIIIIIIIIIVVVVVVVIIIIIIIIIIIKFYYCCYTAGALKEVAASPTPSCIDMGHFQPQSCFGPWALLAPSCISLGHFQPQADKTRGTSSLKLH